MLIALRWSFNRVGRASRADDRRSVRSALVHRRGGWRVTPLRRGEESFEVPGPDDAGEAARFWSKLALYLKGIASLESWEFRDESAQPKEGAA